MEWLKQSPQLQAAIIAAIITVVGIILRDAILKMWGERQYQKKRLLISIKDMRIHWRQLQQVLCGDCTKYFIRRAGGNI